MLTPWGKKDEPEEAGTYSSVTEKMEQCLNVGNGTGRVPGPVGLNLSNPSGTKMVVPAKLPKLGPDSNGPGHCRDGNRGTDRMYGPVPNWEHNSTQAYRLLRKTMRRKLPSTTLFDFGSRANQWRRYGNGLKTGDKQRDRSLKLTFR